MAFLLYYVDYHEVDGDGGGAWNKDHKQESPLQALQSSEYTIGLCDLFPFHLGKRAS